ncbi:hypothetical protein PLESTF_001818500 [Pleodorina starrii]|nr:hypothetical protein PLESTF_001818500 [Pleodorina starrii]
MAAAAAVAEEAAAATAAAAADTAAAAAAPPPPELDPAVEEQRRAAASGRLPAALVDDLALMRPSAAAAGVKGGLQAELEAAEAAAAAAVAAAQAAAAGGVVGEAEEEGGGGGGRGGGAAAPPPAPLQPTAPGQPPQAPATAPPAGTAAAAAAAAQPAQPPAAPAAHVPAWDLYDDSYAIVPRQLTEALSEALAAALRLQRARDCTLWEPDPGDAFADDYMADELAAVSERPPPMVGLAPAALAYSVFVEDWEGEILWEGAAGSGSEAAAAAAAAGGRAGSPTPAAPAAAAAAAGGSIVEEEEEEEEEDGAGEKLTDGVANGVVAPAAVESSGGGGGGGPEAMQVDGPVAAPPAANGIPHTNVVRRSAPPRAVSPDRLKAKSAVWRRPPAGVAAAATAPPRAIPTNRLTASGVWRGRPVVASASELLGGLRARPLSEPSQRTTGKAAAAAAAAGNSVKAGAEPVDAKAALGAAAAAIASAAAAVGASDPLLAAAATAAAAAAAAVTAAARGADDGEPAVPLALLAAPEPAPLPRVADPEAPPPDQRLFVDGQHPQMLRMDKQAAQTAAVGFARSTARYYHPALALSQDDPWVDSAIDAAPGGPPAPLVHNLNDPALVYRAQAPPADGKAGGAAAAAGGVSDALRRAAALVAPPVVRRKVVRGPVMEAAHSEVIGLQLAAFNVSQDTHYTHQAKARVDRTQKSLSRHGTPAITLATLPARLTRDDLLLFHRPRSVWAVGVTAQRAAPALLAAAAKQTKELVYMFKWGRNALDIGFPQHKDAPYSIVGGWPLVPLTPETKLAEAGINKPVRAGPPQNHLYVLMPAMRLIARPHMPEPGQGTKPPAAFGTRASLTACGGHVVLLEYLEEHPPLLGRPAMGARLLTYYQRRDEQDMGHNNLLPPTGGGGGGPAAGAGAGGAGGAAGGGGGGGGGGAQGQGQGGGGGKGGGSGRQMWKLGTVQPLGPENTPFYTVLPPGHTVLCVDTHMFKAPAAPHDPRPSDFLVVRSNNGVVHLRELTGTLSVGQQHPHEKVPEPWDSEWIKNYNSQRIFVVVARALQRARNRNLPYIPRDEIRARIEKECRVPPQGEGRRSGGGGAAAAGANGALRRCLITPEYELPEGVVHHRGEWGEAKLREMVRPDVVCAYEAMRAGELRLKGLGLQHLQALTQVARLEPERWQAAIRQLAELNPKSGPALRLIDWAVNTAPWVTTEAYASATRGDTRGSTWLRVEGPFDPTGRGYGLCFQADWQRVTRPDMKDKPPQEGSITGTEADLRKLGHEEAGRMLMQWGVKKDVVDSMTNRWRRIDLVRKLATQAAMEGTEGFNAHFVRVQRLNVNEKIASARRLACGILQKQLEALRRDRDWGAAPEDYGLLRPLGRRAAPAGGAGASASRRG